MITTNKANKLKVGNKVELRRNGEGLKWHVDHLAWSFGVKPVIPEGGYNGYSADEKEILPESFVAVHGFLHHWLSKKPLVGKVLGYGSQDEENGKSIERRCVLVSFKLLPFNIKYEMYVGEKDLKKV